ncbi:MAG: DUF1501 domain-containing protein [Burkholderiales bacterium]|jgi:uncharacterized protein (DUF1501 family)|nr:DUF1501 domain-containing protein [Burkholderiales bacterium]
MKRRHLLQMSAVAALNPWAQMRALAETAPAAGDYRALVCLFMFGGNDGNNLLVPNDARYTAYQRARPNLALDKATLLPLSLSNAAGLALHPAFTGLQGLINSAQASVVANIGPLLQPTTKAQYDAHSVPLPYNLFSHSDQQGAWQSGVVEAPPRNGWGGRLLERALAEGQTNRGYAALSLSGGNIWEAGDKSLTPYRVSSSGRFGFDFYDPNARAGSDPLSAAIAATLAEARSHPFEQTWLNMMGRSLEVQRVLSAALAASSVSTTFPDTDLGRQLGMAAKLIAARGALGLSRQCFFTSIGGFDTHGDDQLQRQAEAFAEIDAAVTAFNTAMISLGLADCVTLFSASDFGRTFASNGSGTDHAWGNHHFVVGGAARGTGSGNGSKLLGRMPDLTVGGPDDVAQGVWLPTTATDQLGTELARWFGADATTLAAVWPHGGGFDRLLGWG